jgi:alpha-tubulin suppressor-like RCC1 family protein
MKRIPSTLVNASLCIYLMIGQNVSVRASRPASQASQERAAVTTIYLPLVMKTYPTYKAISISTGMFSNCALTDAGGVKCWGYNYDGELGNGTTTDSLTPVNVTGLASGVVGISSGYKHTCALTSAGGVKCWGFNVDGELGDGSIISKHAPVDVSGLTSGVAGISASGYHTCAVMNSGAVKCWGYNAFGQLGDGTTYNRATPVSVSGLASGVNVIKTGEYHTCALMQTGGVKCWGDNDNGQLGDGTVQNKLVPVDVTGLTSGVSALSTGGYHTCALMQTSGLKCWGDNAYGQLGNGTATDSLAPVNVNGLASGVSGISGGFRHTCAVMQGSGAKCWGHNAYGQLGNGTTGSSSTPVDVSGLASGVNVIRAGYRDTCALTTSGGVKCWGDNSYGELGDGTYNNSSTPVSVYGFP